jgi:hypothetical protein
MVVFFSSQIPAAHPKPNTIHPLRLADTPSAKDSYAIEA